MVRYNLETGHNVFLHVKPNGDDALDGLTWGSAKQTIQAAHDALPSTFPHGGTIFLSNGDHAGGTTITKRNVNIVGPGDSARIRVTAAQQFGLYFNGQAASQGGARNFSLAPADTSASVGGILVNTAERLRFESLLIQDFGAGVSPTIDHPINDGPYGMKFTSDVLAAYSDWHEIIACDWFGCYRSFVGPGGEVNGKILGGTMRGSKREAIYCYRGFDPTGTVQGENRWWAFGLYIANGIASQEDAYLIRLTSDPAMNRDIGWKLIGCETEIGHANNTAWGHHILVQGNKCIVDGHTFAGGRAPDDGPGYAVHFVDGHSSVVGPSLLSSKGYGDPVFVQTGTAANNRVWRYASPTALADVTGFYGGV